VISEAVVVIELQIYYEFHYFRGRMADKDGCPTLWCGIRHVLKTSLRQTSLFKQLPDPGFYDHRFWPDSLMYTLFLLRVGREEF
jgi:hypothetical protein